MILAASHPDLVVDDVMIQLLFGLSRNLLGPLHKILVPPSNVFSYKKVRMYEKSPVG